MAASGENGLLPIGVFAGAYSGQCIRHVINPSIPCWGGRPVREGGLFYGRLPH